MNYWLYFIGKFFLYICLCNVVLNIIQELLIKMNTDRDINEYFVFVNSLIISVSLIMIEIGGKFGN